ncbi:MAG: hypothetical protein WAN43_09900 [Rhodomicrobium sp.]|jgi:hypothetical protein
MAVATGISGLPMMMTTGAPSAFSPLIDHCGVDLAACAGDAKQIPNVILAHYRVGRGRYDIERAAHDLLTYPPIAARIGERAPHLAEHALWRSAGVLPVFALL